MNTNNTSKIITKGNNFKSKLPKVKIGELDLKLGLGGIHSVDKPGIFEAKDGYILVDADATSFYPAAIINYLIAPEHLDQELFSTTLYGALCDRKGYKKRKKEAVLFAALEWGLKTGLNAVFGLFGYANFLLFDLLCTYKTTVNNQLFLIQLIEALHLAGYDVISANTDGIVLHIPEVELDNVKSIIKVWEEQTKFEMEYTFYDLYVRRDVNNYVCRKTDGTVKIKGTFVPQGAILKPYYEYDLPKLPNGDYLPINGILKGYKFPVIALALQHYYLSNIDPEDFLYNHTDIYDFCMSAKVGGKFKNYLFEIEKNMITKEEKILSKEEVQKTVRFFVTKPVITETHIRGNLIKKIEKNALVKEKVVIQEPSYTKKVVQKEKRINPETGRMKTYEIVVAPAVRQYKQEMTVEVMKDKEIALSPVGAYITMFNNYYDVAHFSDYNLDIDWYLSECYKIIQKIGTIN